MSAALLNDDYYMNLALQMAASAEGQTGSNPMVGCVIVKDGRVVGLGAHLKQGDKHAEVNALQMAGAEAEGSTVYVTLEPCSHYGRTPPCCDRLIQEKVKKVIVASLDPNPLVAGTGMRRLRESGIEVEVGLLADQANQLNEKFNKFITQKLPFVTLKSASTLDGKIASRTGDSKWITNEHARRTVHQLRHQHEAIMVGVETVIQDDPSLTTRLSVPGIHPLRVIIDSNLRTPLTSKLLNDGLAKVIIMTNNQAGHALIANYEEKGAEVIRCGDGPRVNLNLAMKALGERHISSVLLEGGGTLNGAMLQAKLVDKMICFIAPKIIGGYEAPSNFQFLGYSLMKDAISLRGVQIQSFDDNVCLSGYPVYGEGGEI